MTWAHRIVQQSSLTSGDMATTQDFTVSGFGTPTAWIVTVSHTGDGALIGIGFGTFDGVSVVKGWAGAESQDNDMTSIWVSDSDAQFEAQALDHVSGGATEVLEATGALITDGIRLTYTTKPTAALQVKVDLIQCDDAAVGNRNTVNAAPTDTGFAGTSFTPNIIVVAHSGGLVTTAGYRPCYGFACEDSGATIYQCCEMMASGGNNASPGGATPLQHVDTTRFLAFITGLGAKSSWTLDSFDADGFTYSDSETGTNIAFQYLLLRASEEERWCGALTTPTSTGQEDYTDPGFPAGSVFVIPTYAATADSTLSAGGNGTLGFGSYSAYEQAGMTCSVQDGVTTTNTSSLCSTTQGFLAKSDAGALVLSGTIGTLEDGFSINFDAVDGTARYFLALAVASTPLAIAVDETLELDDEAEVVRMSFLAVDDTIELSDEPEILTIDMEATMSIVDLGAAQPGRSGMQAGQAGRSGMESGQSGR